MLKKSIAAALGAAVSVGVLVSVTPAVSAARCSSSIPEVYTESAAAGLEHGSVIGCTRTRLTLVGAPPFTKTWLVEYATQDVTGKPRSTTAVVLVPDVSWRGPGPRPLVAFAPGTVGGDDSCAASRALTPAGGEFGSAVLSSGINNLLGKGMAVVVADGVGYQDGQTHPYVVGGTAGRALLDGARAAFRVPGTGLDPAAKVGISGYSEGGHTALWGAQLARSYAPELDMAGVAAGGVPGDLKLTAEQLNGNLFSGFLALAIVGAHDTYPQLPLEELANEEGLDAIEFAASACDATLIPGLAFRKVESLTTLESTLDELYAIPGSDGVTWGERIEESRVGVGVGTGPGATYRVDFPVFQYRGILDELIGQPALQYSRDSYCAAGVTTRSRTYPGEHALTGLLAAEDVSVWLNDRFTGATTERGTCPGDGR